MYWTYPEPKRTIREECVMSRTIDKLLITVVEAAYYLHYSTQYVYNLLKEGKLRYKKKGRDYLIFSEDVENYAKSTLLRKKPG